MSGRRVIGYAPRNDARTIAVDAGKGKIELVRRQRHYTAEIVPAEDPVKRVPTDPGARLIRELEADCRRWFDVLRRCPMPGDYLILKRGGQASGWLAQQVARVEREQAMASKAARRRAMVAAIFDGPPAPRAPSLTPADLDFLDHMTDVIIALHSDPLAWRLVTGRAQRIGWKDLAQYDVQGRKVRQLQNVYREYLCQLLPVWLTKVRKI